MPVQTDNLGDTTMKQELSQIQQKLSCIEDINTILLFSGIELRYLSLTGNNFSIHHKQYDHIMVINYCHSGRIGWKLEKGNYVYLGAGDFSIHTMKLCADSEINLPNNCYEGIMIYIDLNELTKNPPQLLLETGITGTTLYEKLCKNETFISLTGNEQTECIFQFFYNQPMNMQLAYQKIKVLELLLYLYQAENISGHRITGYQTDQIEVIRKIHEQLLHNLNRRFTIEELSKQYFINPTTMKSLFKSVYGTSIAAHMKEHRMREAAKMLLESNMSIAEVASAVGYDSQSKFSTAFKGYFQMLPKEYKKNH